VKEKFITPYPGSLITNLIYEKPAFKTIKCGKHPKAFKCIGDSKELKIVLEEVVGEYGHAAFGKILKFSRHIQFEDF